MKFSENWLRSLINPPFDSKRLAEVLTMAGLEVEDSAPAAPDFSRVVVAQVREIRKHENAEKLNVCLVDVGLPAQLQIVCGASNVAVGIKVPCALVGAVLPGGLQIKEALLRGVASFGMLCSSKELGLAEENSGLLLLADDAPIGTDLRSYFDLDDQVHTLKLTPNRSDCLSVLGLARELAALCNLDLRAVPIDFVAPDHDAVRSINVLAPQACPRYLGRVLRDVDAGVATPEWMVQRLVRAGIRPLSAVVDISNYVMLELGQPLHAFDNAKLSGSISVRFADTSETIALLNGKTLALESDMLVIADERGPIALAGIMGGAESSVQVGQTNEVFLEAAYFVPTVIAGKSRRLGFGSESSYRYERGVDFAQCQQALDRATCLIQAICGGKPGPVQERSANLPSRDAVSVRTARVELVLGLAITTAEIEAMLTRLGLEITVSDDKLYVIPPSYRYDLVCEEDIIEEVARLYGYDNIPLRPPLAAQTILPQDGKLRPALTLKTRLVERGYQEIVSYAFVDASSEADLAGNADPIRLINPIASQMSVMRSSLFGGLVSNLRHNIHRKHERVRLFELARVFLRDGDGYAQPERLGGIAYGARWAEQWGEGARPIDFYDVKADVASLLATSARFEKAAHPALHPGRSAQIFADDVYVGVIGELHPRWVQTYEFPAAPVLFELDVAALTRQAVTVARVVAKSPSVRRDLAFILDAQISYQQVLDAMKSVESALVKHIEGFDVYSGKGIPESKKSLAFKVILQDTRTTLTDAEVEKVVSLLVSVVQQRFDAQLRQG